MAHVFISYSKKNRAYARTLADHLLRLGFDVWIDDRIDYGEMWERTIFKAIDDCSAFLIIMTPESYQSDWVLREIQYADRRRKPQFPVLLDGEDFPRYGPHQHVDVRGGILPPEDFFKRLEKAAPRKEQTGINVTPAEVAIPPTDTLPKTPAALPTISRGINTRIAAGIGVGVLALLVIALLLNRPPTTDNQVKTLIVETATLRQEMTELSTLLTSEKTAEVASLPTIAKTNTAIPSPSLTVSPTRTVTPAPSPTDTAAATFTRTPTETPTIDIAMAVNTLDAEATIHVRETNKAVTVTVRAGQTATAASWTDTPTPTATLTPNITASIEAFLTQRAAQTATAIAAFKTATADAWTDTPTPTSTFTNTPTATPTFTPTYTPTLTPTAQGGGAGQIAFDSNRDRNSEIYVMNADGSNLRRLTNNSTFDVEAAWSPNGSQITFRSYRDGNYEIYVMNADGSNPRNLTNNPANDYFPAWSPDGSQIAFSSYRDENLEIYVMNADGSNLHNISNNSGNDHEPAWSPDGSQIAFSSFRDGNYEIYVMNADGSNPHNVSNNSGGDYEPAWSPDGSQIAFHASRDGNYEIYVMNADGSNPHNVSNNSGGELSPSWSPDGSQIAFVSNRNGKTEIYVMDANGGNLHNISNSPDDDYPHWRPAAPNPDPLLNVPIVGTAQSPTQAAVAATARPSSTPEPTYSVNTYLLQFSNVIFHISNDQRINARSGPGSQYSITGGANPSSKGAAIYLSTDGNWVYAYLDNINYFGWISINYVRVEQGNLYALPRSDKAGQ